MAEAHDPARLRSRSGSDVGVSSPRYVDESTSTLSTTAMAQCRRAAQLMLEAMKMLAEASAAFARRGAVLAVQSSRLPDRSRELLMALGRQLEELRQWEVWQVRPSAPPPSRDEEWSRNLSKRCQELMAAVRLLPRPAAVTVGLLSLKLLTALGAVGDAAICELLHSRTTLCRIGLCMALAPGWLLAFAHRDILLKDMGRRPLGSLPAIAEAAEADDALFPHAGAAGTALAAAIQADASKGLSVTSMPSSLEWHLQLVQNLRCLPPYFWLAACVSGAISLQAAKEFAVGAVHKVLQVRLRFVLLVSVLLPLLSQVREEEVLVNYFERLPPAAARVLTNLWYNSQAAARTVSGSLASRVSKTGEQLRLHAQAALRGGASCPKPQTWCNPPGSLDRFQSPPPSPSVWSNTLPHFSGGAGAPSAPSAPPAPNEDTGP